MPIGARRERQPFLAVGGGLRRARQRALLDVRAACRGQAARPDDGGGLRCVVRDSPHPFEAVVRRERRQLRPHELAQITSRKPVVRKLRPAKKTEPRGHRAPFAVEAED